MNEYTVADMHTHSENSHDSVCPIEDMLLSQIEKGTKIFAVTDHFDTDSFDKYDVFTPIKTSFETVDKLNKKYGDRCEILSGVEIGEGFWHPEVYNKIINMLDYDVVIGSVHLVKYEGMSEAYSGFDFSRFSKAQVENFVDAYFDDILTMLRFADLDILAHLTCPLRYIKGRCGISVDMSRYDEKIEKILNVVIEKGIALEVNTSSYGMLNDFMPSADILKKYREMGGYLITLGSDAHIAENASANFAKAISTLKKLGYENICYYKKRKPFHIKI